MRFQRATATGRAGEGIWELLGFLHSHPGSALQTLTTRKSLCESHLTSAAHPEIFLFHNPISGAPQTGEHSSMSTGSGCRGGNETLPASAMDEIGKAIPNHNLNKEPQLLLGAPGAPGCLAHNLVPSPTCLQHLPPLPSLQQELRQSLLLD